MLRKCFLVLCLSIFPFLCSLDSDFVFDDSEAIINNKDVTSKTWLKTFYNDFWGTYIKSNLSHKSYRPLTTLTFRFNYILSGEKLIALHFKITNLICHGVCCILLLFVYQIILKRLKICPDGMTTNLSLLATMLFAVHPIHVEAVSGIVGRADILATITFLISFIFYDQSLSCNKLTYLYLLSTVFLAGVAMLFKENGITVLGFCIIYDIVINGNLKPKHSRKNNLIMNIDRKASIRIIVVSLAAVFLMYARWLIMDGMKPEFKPGDNPAAFANNTFTKMQLVYPHFAIYFPSHDVIGGKSITISGTNSKLQADIEGKNNQISLCLTGFKSDFSFVPVATFNYIYFLNFLLLLWPQWLCYDWSMGCVQLIESVLDFRIMFVILFYSYGILQIRAVFHSRNSSSSKRLILLATSLSTIPFMPAANILFPVGFVIAERILYLPSAGYCLLVAFGFNRIFNHTRKNMNKAGIAAFLGLILIYSLKTWERAYVWRNEYSLFVDGLNVCPLNAKVRYNVAKVVDARHNTTWALSEYREAIRLYPEYYQAMNNLGNILKNQKKFDEAEFYFKRAINLKQDFPAAWMNLGIVLANAKRFNESLNAYKTALRYRRKYPDCLYNLGNLYLEMKDTKAAGDNWSAAIHFNPKHSFAWTNLIAMLDNTGQTERALEIIPKALSELPNTPALIFAVANIYGRINRFSEAETLFKTAIQLFNEKVQAIHYANLGVLYHRWKKHNLAEEMYKRALQIDPTFKSAKKNLALLRKK